MQASIQYYYSMHFCIRQYEYTNGYNTYCKHNMENKNAVSCCYNTNTGYMDINNIYKTSQCIVITTGILFNQTPYFRVSA